MNEPSHYRVPLSEAFTLLLDTYIFPYAFRSDAALFAARAADVRTKHLLLQYATEIRDLYALYATDDPRRRGPKRAARLTAATLTQCLKDRQVLDATLTSDVVQSIVRRVTRAKLDGAAGGSGPATASNTASKLLAVQVVELSVEEFEHALTVVACYKHPDPYASLETRLELFLARYIRGNTESSG
jgi:hypothetical protein